MHAMQHILNANDSNWHVSCNLQGSLQIVVGGQFRSETRLKAVDEGRHAVLGAIPGRTQPGQVGVGLLGKGSSDMHSHVAAVEVLKKLFEHTGVEHGLNAALTGVENEVGRVKKQGVGQLVGVRLLGLTALKLKICRINRGLFIVQLLQFVPVRIAHYAHVVENQSDSIFPSLHARVCQFDSALEHGELVQ